MSETLLQYDLLKQLLAHTPDIVFFKDRDSRYIECNDALVRLTGVPREVLLGNNTSYFLSPDVSEQAVKEDREVMESGQPMRSEQWVEFADGKLALMDTIIAPIHDESGVAVGILGIGRDITSYMNASLSLKDKVLALEKANRELDALLYHAAHDLRAPLSSLLGLTTVMRQEKDPVKLQRLFDLQAAHISKMDTFIQDIVMLSRNTRSDIEVQEIDLEKVFFEIIDQFRFLEGAAQMKFEFQDTGLPLLNGDAMRLKLVLGNLISNAVRYHDPRKPQPSLRLQAHVELDKAILKLEDNGIGIAPEHVNRIFDMFYRAHKTSKGSGIGLYITQETLHKIGGTIRVESELGRGSTFIVELPNHRLEA